MASKAKPSGVLWGYSVEEVEEAVRGWVQRGGGR
jgi:hypothetical protein